jgi:hypothetical protein
MWSLRPTLLLAAAILARGAEADVAPVPPVDDSWWTKERKLIGLNIGLNAAVVTYGFTFWDWGSTSFRTTTEHWFKGDTSYGGVDKVGHAYTGFLIGSLLAHRYAAWGYEREEAAAYGALSSLAFTTLVEVGDALSDSYGFSREDAVMNATGAAFSWLRERSPTLQGLVDFRIQYLPSEAVWEGETVDLVTDYDGMRHLLAFKLAGLPGCAERWPRFIELHVGYYTRGFAQDDERDRRVLYGAIGLNVNEVVAALWKRRSRVFEYYQLPYTYVGAGKEWE